MPANKNKSTSRFIDDLFSSVQREAAKTSEKDEWLDKVSNIPVVHPQDFVSRYQQLLRKG
jgi:hypothetical protein